MHSAPSQSIRNKEWQIQQRTLLLKNTHTHTRKFQPMLNGAVYLHLYCGRIFDIYNPSCYIWKPHQDDNIKKIKYKPCSPLKKNQTNGIHTGSFLVQVSGTLAWKKPGNACMKTPSWMGHSCNHSWLHGKDGRLHVKYIPPIGSSIPELLTDIYFFTSKFQKLTNPKDEHSFYQDFT